MSLHLTPMGEIGPPPTATPSAAGWLMEENRAGLAELLADGKTRWILEIGSFLGLSARFMLDQAPEASIVCVDTWAGAVTGGVADYEVFRASCWEYRYRIVAVKGDSRFAVPALLDQGFRPELIYIDGDHSFEGALYDVCSALRFPGARVCGDDYAPEFPGVMEAVHYAVENSAHRRPFRHAGRFYDLGRNPLPPRGFVGRLMDRLHRMAR